MRFCGAFFRQWKSRDIYGYITVVGDKAPAAVFWFVWETKASDAAMP